MGKIINRAEFAELLGKSPRRVSQWIDEGMPVESAGRKGVPVQIDTARAIGWLLDRAASIAAPTPLPPDQRVVDPEELSPSDRKLWYDGEKRRMELMEKCGELVPAAEVEQEFAALFKALAQAVETFPDRAEREHGATPVEVTRLQELGDQLREIMYQAANSNDQESAP